MEHLRLIVPVGLREAVDAALDVPDVVNVIVIEGSGVRPAGDVILCDVQRAAMGRLIRDLDRLGVNEHGSIAVENIDLSVVPESKEPQHIFGGDDDALVLQEVESRTEAEVRLSATYLVFIAVATGIGGVGVVLDQPVLLVAAMVVGPDFGPLAAISVGLVRRHARGIRRSVLTAVVGYAVGIAFTLLMSLLLIATGVFPRTMFDYEHEPLAAFIWQPNVLSTVIGLFAGIAGMLSLTSAKSSALVGVLISMNTIPAAAAIGVAASYGAWAQVGGAGLEFLLSLASIIIGAAGTLAFQLTMLGRRVRGWPARLRNGR
ncbi:DUF389 domain-containing protein [Agromyces archimandritae]|uniref:DUF389 domain-containing protein n=1 Tax=Agromyces archimandritae TaxID=2781962 RepID=A0A975IRC6_9MICO|nr:DUF389 domain-containing protein [Agromyces archimandritae]QTX05946.1 DUF389 domain-containing protein [Agromyces archimandritae]